MAYLEKKDLFSLEKYSEIRLAFRDKIIQHKKNRRLGLNPHAGDGGYIGKEEQDIIYPVIESLNKNGLNIIGPVSADTAFIEKNTDIKADAFLAMFHDQGLPVIKTMSFGEIVNITLGLPFIRTSVDHGTAYDKAGTLLANETSLITCLLYTSDAADE